jgi:hypothetical protein
MSITHSFTVLDRSALFRVGVPCFYCGETIRREQAPAALDVISTTSGHQTAAHAYCYRWRGPGRPGISCAPGASPHAC